MKKSIVFTGTIALALLTAPSVLANEADTVVTKEDTNITVQNPSVEVTTSNDTIYADVDVKVNDIQSQQNQKNLTHHLLHQKISLR